MPIRTSHFAVRVVPAVIQESDAAIDRGANEADTFLVFARPANVRPAEAMAETLSRPTPVGRGQLMFAVIRYHRMATMVNLSVIRPAAELDVPLNRDIFLRTLIRELSGTLEDVVGIHEASGFISVVGQNVGDQMNRDYRSALKVTSLSREQVAQVLVDLKRRIQGDFFVVEETDKKIVLGNRACPFGEKVLDRSSMCMMTSNVFGAIAAENLGYAKVELQQTIAKGDPGCLVVVHLSPTPEAEAAEGREYFRAEG